MLIYISNNRCHVPDILLWLDFKVGKLALATQPVFYSNASVATNVSRR